MKPMQIQKWDFDTIVWGAFFIWWGITELFPTLPTGTGALGIGLILLGLNVARARSGVPASFFSTVLGILFLILGGLGLVSELLNLPFELPTFAILLIVLGGSLLANELHVNRNQKMEGLQ